MPKIPIVRTQQVRTPFINVNATPQQFGSGTAQALGDLSGGLGEVASFVKNRRDALDNAEYTNIYTKASRELNEHLNTVTLQSDFNNLSSTYLNGANDIKNKVLENVSNPRVKDQISQDLDKIITRDLNKASGASITKAKDYAVASLNANRQEFVDLYVNASNTDEKAEIKARYLFQIENMYQGGMISATDAQKRSSDFQNDVEFVQAQRIIRNNAEDFEPENFRNLNEQQKIQLQDQALRFIEKQDRQLEMQIKEAQKARMNKILLDINTDQPLTEEQIKNDPILSDEDKVTAIKTLKKGTTVRDDAYALSEINNSLVDGNLNEKMLQQYLADGLITDSTYEQKLESITVNIERNPAVKRASKAIELYLDQSGQLDIFGDKSVEASLKQELIQRSRSGNEDPDEVAKELIERQKQVDLNKQFELLERSARQELGAGFDVNDVIEQQQKILDDVSTGKISEEFGRQQYQVLEKIKGSL